MDSYNKNRESKIMPTTNSGKPPVKRKLRFKSKMNDLWLILDENGTGTRKVKYGERDRDDEKKQNGLNCINRKSK